MKAAHLKFQTEYLFVKSHPNISIHKSSISFSPKLLSFPIDFNLDYCYSYNNRNIYKPIKLSLKYSHDPSKNIKESYQRASETSTYHHFINTPATLSQFQNNYSSNNPHRSYTNNELYIHDTLLKTTSITMPYDSIIHEIDMYASFLENQLIKTDSSLTLNESITNLDYTINKMYISDLSIGYHPLSYSKMTVYSRLSNGITSNIQIKKNVSSYVSLGRLTNQFYSPIDTYTSKDSIYYGIIGVVKQLNKHTFDISYVNYFEMNKFNIENTYSSIINFKTNHLITDNNSIELSIASSIIPANQYEESTFSDDNFSYGAGLNSYIPQSKTNINITYHQFGDNYLNPGNHFNRKGEKTYKLSFNQKMLSNPNLMLKGGYSSSKASISNYTYVNNNYHIEPVIILKNHSIALYNVHQTYEYIISGADVQKSYQYQNITNLNVKNSLRKQDLILTNTLNLTYLKSRTESISYYENVISNNFQFNLPNTSSHGYIFTLRNLNNQLKYYYHTYTYKYSYKSLSFDIALTATTFNNSFNKLSSSLGINYKLSEGQLPISLLLNYSAPIYSNHYSNNYYDQFLNTKFLLTF